MSIRTSSNCTNSSSSEEITQDYTQRNRNNSPTNTDLSQIFSENNSNKNKRFREQDVEKGNKKIKFHHDFHNQKTVNSNSPTTHQPAGFIPIVIRLPSSGISPMKANNSNLGLTTSTPASIAFPQNSSSSFNPRLLPLRHHVSSIAEGTHQIATGSAGLNPPPIHRSTRQCAA